MSVIPTPSTPSPTPADPTPSAVAAVVGDPAAAAAPKAEGEKKDDFLAPRFAALAKKEKAARSQIEAAKQLQAQIAEREAKIKELEAKYSKKPANPIEALMQHGFTYQEATDYILNGEKPTADLKIKTVEDRLAEFERKQEERELKALEDAKKDEERGRAEAIENFKGEIKDYVTKNADTYELINLHETYDLIYQTVAEHFQETREKGEPKILSVQEAADLVEKHLEDIVDRTLKTKKIQSRLSPKPSDPKADEPKLSSGPSKTLAAATFSSSAPSMLPAKTEMDRISRAMAALDGRK
jgi:hypothetical protein